MKKTFRLFAVDINSDQTILIGYDDTTSPHSLKDMGASDATRHAEQLSIAKYTNPEATHSIEIEIDLEDVETPAKGEKPLFIPRIKS